MQRTEGSTRQTGLTNRTQSEERYQAFIQGSSEGIWRFELDAPISIELSAKAQVRRMFESAYVAEANLAIARMYGFASVKSIVGLRLGQFMTESDLENVSFLESFVAGGYKLVDVESHEVDNAGHEKYFRTSLTGIVEDGHLVRAWGTQQDVTKRLSDLASITLTNAQLKSQQAQLLAINKTKDEFIALASHQLRTPATAVKQYTSLLIHEFAGPLTAEQLKYLRIAFDSNERQLQIINDLLKTAQIDSSRYVLEKKPQDMAKLIKQAAKELRATCELKNQKITLIGIKSTIIEVDANEIKLVLVNLLENASKYSYPDTEITLTMHASGKRLEIAVTDVGVGVRKEDARRIFDKFTRVDNELSDTVTGTGFGLYWVKRIINLHGGSIKVESAVGKGSTFIVRLPL